ncbi:amidase [Actimicrobium antarcticum]|uniref:Amidase n=1 Tax=Actimicrobium antarcticum TaxID=1051899 RepID=A0ABP7TS37_9BURK
MHRRNFIKLGAAGALGTVAISANSAIAASGQLNLIDASVAQLQAAMTAGTLTATALTKHYLARIKAIDQAGPHINAVIERNPDALTIAAALDAERKSKGPRGPLHGIPVLIKDNIATADRMQTTAGSLALVGAKAPRDAFLVTQLREAGAVILGKTNLSEWANIRSTRSTSGWSARGGLTRNPYALDRNTSGSSSGSAAAIAASLAAIAVGTETDGSITSPASICGLVGLKPTVGLISRDGIIPISHTQDTPGPMTRSVADAAVLLGAMTGTDPHDSATAGIKRQDYMRFLDADGLRGARIGVVRNATASHPAVQALASAALAVMAAKGAILVDVELPNISKYGDSELEVLLYELKTGLNTYLAEFATGAPVRTLNDVIAFNQQHRATEMGFFDQELFLRAEAKGGLDSPEYLAALANNRQYSRTEGIDQVLAEYKLDALFAPTGGPAWLTDTINADHFGDSFSTPAAVAGYPHITVPAGYVAGLPVGVSFVAGAYAEGMLIKLAYAFEQSTLHRRAPGFPASVKQHVG